MLVWEQCLKLIKNKVAEQSFDTWFKPIKAVKLSGSALTIQVPSQFFYEWIEEHYVHILKEA
jgi:chromosomal replication initiator protein